MKIKTLAFLMCFLVSGCVIGHAYYEYRLPTVTVLNDKGFTLNVTRFRGGGFDTNYFVFLTVKNISEGELVFDSADLELLDETTGISMYSISKDASGISTPISSSDIIAKSTIKPGKTISGEVMFPTQDGRAKSKNLTLSFGKQVIKLTR